MNTTLPATQSSPLARFNITLADIVAAVSAILLGNAFGALNWIGGDTGATGLRILSNSQGLAQGDIILLFIMFLAVVIGCQSVYLAVFVPQNRRSASRIAGIAGAFGLLYFVVYFLASMVGSLRDSLIVTVPSQWGIGFWLALLGSGGLVVQAFIPRPEYQPTAAKGYRFAIGDALIVEALVVGLISFVTLPYLEGRTGIQMLTDFLGTLSSGFNLNDLNDYIVFVPIGLVIVLIFTVVGALDAERRQRASMWVAVGGTIAIIFFVMFFLNINASVTNARLQNVVGAGYWLGYFSCIVLILQAAISRNEAGAPVTPKITPSRTPQEGEQRSALLASTDQQTVGEFVNNYVRRVRSGDLGPLPILIGLVGIALFFQSQNQRFLSAGNIVNLILQMAVYATVAYGIIFVLLLGEIDLSAGFVSGVAGVMATVALRPPFTTDWGVAVFSALGTATCIGFLQGVLITGFQLPSFIVTLAGLLTWNGVVLLMVGQGGTIRVPDSPVQRLAGTFLQPELGWLFAAIVVLGYAAVQFNVYRNRRAQNLNARPLPILIVQILAVAIMSLGIVWVCNRDRGLPLLGALLIVFLVVLTYITQSTRFGRYLIAVGGNIEAARRAGIRVERIRMLGFMMCSFMAGVGGIVLASRLQSVATNTGGGQLLLNVIAAAVIGGTSLFGGRGSIYSALLGALVIASLENGMVFLGASAAVQYIITGIVLVLAVIVDSVSRNNQKRSGLA